ncbi:MAG TPA: glycosyltransferase family A protein [Thermoleophilaceae bacterium]|nr:glycosyltransferase family A protein [Thermoleophilaceae bacterium]
MSTDAPKARVAVLIPCYEDGALIAEAVDSVREDEPFELVVIDDCSPGEYTQSVMNELRERGITVVRHEQNRGVAGARNTGLRATTAPYIFALDSDDLAAPGILAHMADLLDAHPEADLCFGDYQEFGENDSVRVVPLKLDPFRLLYTNEYPQTAMFRRTLLDSIGGWDEHRLSEYSYEDWALWLNLVSRGATSVHAGPDVITHYQRVHGPRMLEAARLHHREIYSHLRRANYPLFSRRRELRAASDLPLSRKLLYPVLYGGRHRFAFEPHVKDVMERVGVWRRAR